MTKKTQFSLWSCLCWITCIFAQNSDTLVVNYFGHKQGLLQLNVKALTQDDKEYLWVGTEDGLHQFNGAEFKVYSDNPLEEHAIADDHIRDVHAVNDTLWIATNSHGISYYKQTEQQFHELDLSDFDSEVNISHKIFETPKHLFFSVKNHLICFNRSSKIYEVLSLPKSNTEVLVEDVLPLNDGWYWLAINKPGVIAYHPKNKQFKSVEELKDITVTKFYETDTSVWIGTIKGVYVYTKSTRKLVKVGGEFHVKDMIKKSDLELWLGTSSGVFTCDMPSHQIAELHLKDQFDKSYASVDLNEMYSDNKGNVWLGTEARGLLHYNQFKRIFTTQKIQFSQIDGQKISTFPFLKTTDGMLWITTDMGLVRYDEQLNSYIQYNSTKDDLIYALAEDGSGTLWAGGFSSGLLKYNTTTDSFKAYVHDENKSASLPDNDVIEIIPLSVNELLVCTWSGGINTFNIETEQFSPYLINGKKIDRARISLVDSKKNIWLGTDEGLYKIDANQQVTHYVNSTPEEQVLTSNRIFAVKEDSKGNIWVGTSSGITKIPSNYNSETTKYYKMEGFPNDFVYSLLIDANDNIWVSTNMGVSVLSVETERFTNYTSEDGLQSNEFNGKSGYKDTLGNFYFGGIDGYNVFNPNKLVSNTSLPQVHIESVALFNKPLTKIQDTMYFKSTENVLSFKFAALNYLNQDKCLYQYKMEGFDTDWSPVSKKQNTTYTNLSPGTYTFEVRATNDVGKWVDVPKRMTVVIIPMWYETLWFKLSVILLVITVITLWYYRKVQRLKEETVKLERLVNERTQDLKDKNIALADAYGVSVKQKENIQVLMKELSHRVKNNLQIISSLINIQANTTDDKESKDILEIAKNRVLTISFIQDQLESNIGEINLGEFIKSFTYKLTALVSKQPMLSYKTVFDIDDNCVGEFNTTLIGLILNELISNMAKYAFESNSESNMLKISCKKDENSRSIVLTIEDNGVGYTLNDVTPNSLGLELIREMIDQLDGQINTSTNNGVKNRIVIPY
ncbi:MAG: ligand-binding sensor domain-containing protein [Flavobacteriaceae bacterium]